MIVPIKNILRSRCNARILVSLKSVSSHLKITVDLKESAVELRVAILGSVGEHRQTSASTIIGDRFTYDLSGDGARKEESCYERVHSFEYKF